MSKVVTMKDARKFMADKKIAEDKVRAEKIAAADKKIAAANKKKETAAEK